MCSICFKFHININLFPTLFLIILCVWWLENGCRNHQNRALKTSRQKTKVSQIFSPAHPLYSYSPFALNSKNGPSSQIEFLKLYFPMKINFPRNSDFFNPETWHFEHPSFFSLSLTLLFGIKNLVSIPVCRSKIFKIIFLGYERPTLYCFVCTCTHLNWHAQFPLSIGQLLF